MRTFLYRLIFGLIICVLLWNTAVGLNDYFSGYYSYKDDIICEWLVNYEGGVIRRGITGQLLYWFYQIRPYPVSDTIVFIFYVGVVLLLFFLIKMFVKRGWSLFLLPFPAFLFTFLGYRFLISRRDAWMLLLACLFFFLYKKYVSNRSLWFLVGMNLIIVLGMLIYESILFFVFPIVFFHFLWMKCQGNDINVIKTIVVWLPSLLMPFIILECAGTQQMTIEMMQSWMPLFTRYPMGDAFAVEDIYLYNWIGQPLLDHMRGVLNEGWFSSSMFILPRWIFNIYMFIAIYYLTTRLNTVNLKFNKLKQYDVVQLSNVVIIQFLFLLPYILFLSDDMARNMTYWTVSSFMFFYFFGDSKFSPDWMNRLSSKIQNAIQRNRFLSNPYTYLIVLLTLPLEFHGGGLKMIFPIIPQEIKHIVASYVQPLV